MYGKVGFVKMLALALAGLVAAFPAQAGESAGPKPHMMYFYNPSCRLCTRTNEVVAAAEKKYESSMSYQRFNIADSESGTDNIMYMFDLMDELKVPEEGNVTLIVFLGILDEENGEYFFTPKRALVEGEEIMEKLDSTIADFLATDGKGGLALGVHLRPATFFSGTALASVPPTDVVDHLSGPPRGEETVRPTIRPSIRRSGASDDGEAPAGNRPAIRRGASGEEPPAKSGAVAVAEAKLEFWTLTVSGLADSVNPCAFATIIILVAMMSSAKRTKREIIAVCLSFTASVFVTYFAIGLFLHTLISEMQAQQGWFLVAMDLVYYFAFALCVICGFFSLRDAYLLFSGRSAEEMTLKLPKAFKKRINVAMAKGVRASWLVVGVFLAGVSVSFLEAACTGQVYLPSIMLIANLERWHAVALLAWYNLLFVLPLLIIFGLVLLGMTSQQLAEFFKKHVGWTRLVLGVVFIVMGCVLWGHMYWPPGYRG